MNNMHHTSPIRTPHAYLSGILFSIILLVCTFSLSSAQDPSSWQVERNMPSFYQQIKSNLTFPMAWGNFHGKDFTEWRNASREKLLECMLTQPPAPESFNVEQIAVEHRDGYTVKLIELSLSAWYRVKAYYLVPDGEGPFPAILLLHDHGAEFRIGKEKLVCPMVCGSRHDPASDSLADKWVEKCYDGVYVADYYAKNGYAVFVTDALLWGERGRREGASYDVQQALASNLFQMGMCWGGLITYDDIASASFLAQCPEVNPGQIAAVGFSMGGYRAWMLAAASDLVSAGVSVCWINTTEYLMTMDNNQNKGGSAYSMLLPGIRNYLDYPHTASIACPKPMLFINGRSDKLFPVKGVEDSFGQMRSVWASQGASESLVTELWDGGHFFSKQMQKRVLDFLNTTFTSSFRQ